ncbi:angiopoietin-related protein 3 [Corythoichthys intestinalis]|uniref:angiopoietin-related protein 3 n=1 Tax=Corythoichthys intestinalis TaxID=161448 RepID=UPI0025A4ECE6|nr:angiopoietin-related protein 3 [Corythoichthys intestinalis]XP_061790265.1 angiopoietin-related protein 3-like [Nerophis lumbriciformis]
MTCFFLMLLIASSIAAVPLENLSQDDILTMTSENLTTAPSPTEAKSRFAMLDDVRLLANGLLQLGQSLREFVHKTKNQINDIFQKLNIFDKSFNHLSVVTSEIKEEEEELKRTTSVLKTNNEEIKNLSLEINAKINNIVQERAQLQNKVGSLEERLMGLSEHMIPADQHKEITTLKGVIETQEKAITNLLKAVQEQHEQLDYQKIKIKNMEDKLNADTLQDTADKIMDLETAPDVFAYLTRNVSENDLPVDCTELFERKENRSGIYIIKPHESEPFYAYCEMGSDGGLTVIQRRVDGSVDFDQTWEKYENGFGELENDFWLGLKKIHSITQQGLYILRIDMEDWKEDKHWAEYHFSLDGPSENYALNLSNYSGDLIDAMANSSSKRFSTKDQKNGNPQVSNCARNYTGGWWFAGCGENNLNGRYLWVKAKGRAARRRGLHWKPGNGAAYSLKMTKFSVRSVTNAEGLK